MKLATENLVKSYSKRTVVDHVSIELNQGEVVGLLGPNGAGKTTTFYMVVGLIKPQQGRIILNDEDITLLPMYKRARKGIGYLAQDPSIFRKLTVEENLMVVLQTLDIPKSEQKARMEQLINDLDISLVAKQKAYTLSGGERRRVEIARSLAISPKFLLLDEPFSGIDPIAVAEIQKIISKLRELGLGVLITDHSVRETLDVIDRGYLISDGKIRMSATPEEFLESEQARKLYLGEEFTI
ncbi:TPA: LPS export ABC transporter ATP-binding protein [Candidatus Poribacteria bacterium]|nr:LPS export ABC transporter ATP-binding protein [Candidatus Poribacteria bacterium]